MKDGWSSFQIPKMRGTIIMIPFVPDPFLHFLQMCSTFMIFPISERELLLVRNFLKGKWFWSKFKLEWKWMWQFPCQFRSLKAIQNFRAEASLFKSRMNLNSCNCNLMIDPHYQLKPELYLINIPSQHYLGRKDSSVRNFCWSNIPKLFPNLLALVHY